MRAITNGDTGSTPCFGLNDVPGTNECGVVTTTGWSTPNKTAKTRPQPKGCNLGQVFHKNGFDVLQCDDNDDYVEVQSKISVNGSELDSMTMGSEH